MFGFLRPNPIKALKNRSPKSGPRRLVFSALETSEPTHP